MLRQEYKYLVPNVAIDFIKELIQSYVIRDDHRAVSQLDEYTVVSIYFDTLNLDQYYKNLSGDYAREKIRVRGYMPISPNDILYLEIKSKTNMRHRKFRAPILRNKIHDIFSGTDITKYIIERSDFPDALKNASNFIYHIHSYNMRPIIKVIYEREAFIYKFDHSLRITLDKNLRCTQYPSFNDFYIESDIKYVFKNYTILEVKSNSGFPLWMIPIINKVDIQREALSKYTLSIEKCINSIDNFSKNQIVAKSNNLNFYYSN